MPAPALEHARQRRPAPCAGCRASSPVSCAPRPRRRARRRPRSGRRRRWPPPRPRGRSARRPRPSPRRRPRRPAGPGAPGPGRASASAFSSSSLRDSSPISHPRAAKARASDFADAPGGAGEENSRAGLELHGGSMPSMAQAEHHEATVAEEEYLQVIFWLREAGLPMTGANVARAMQVSAPTVHEMIGRLESDGYVTRRDDKSHRVHRVGPGSRRGDRATAPSDRALPHRCLRHPLGRGARGGRAPRALDVTHGRGADAQGHRRRPDVPPRAPDLQRAPGAGRAAGRRRGGRQRAGASLRERGRGPPALPDGVGSHAGPRGHPRLLRRPRRCPSTAEAPPTP